MSRHRSEFYRLQAHLMWAWRPSRLAMVRRTILGYVAACLALAITARVLSGLGIADTGALLLTALLLLILDTVCSIVLRWLLVTWPILVAQLLGLAIEFGAIVILGRAMPGVRVDSTSTAVLVALLLTFLNSLFAELVSVSDDDSYYAALVQRLVARDFGRAAEPTAGLLVVQIDGLSLPVLRQALRAGRVPFLASLMRDEGATLHRWVAQLPSTTPACQAGILHGRNDGIPGFRWYEKSSRRMMVANHPEDAAEIVRRISDGRGLLADDGASIGNLVTGDAPRSYLTMATITEASPPGDARRMRGFFVTTVNYVRLAVLMVGEVAKELYQAERQRGRAVEPRMHRDLHYAVERAVTNVALRTVSTALVIEEMYHGAPTIYVDYTGYDAIAHHSGPERPEALDALEGLDRSIGSLRKAARTTRRAYRMVVLSDHGQSLGATFRQQNGESIETVIAAQLGGSPSVVGTGGSVESAGIGRHIASEVGRTSFAAWVVHRVLSGSRATTAAEPGTVPPDVVVCSSGNLAHVYLTADAGVMSSEAIEGMHPGFVERLAAQPGIGAVIARTAGGQVRLSWAHGQVDLGDSVGAGDVPGAANDRLTAEPDPQAAADLVRLASFPNSGDLILLGAVDRESNEVVGFEELIGSHGGLGGWQCDAFILSPASLEPPSDPLVGAPAVHRQLVAWQEQLGGR